MSPATEVPALELGPGYRISPVLQGCWQLAADHGSAALDFATLCRRWDEDRAVGLTTFDCADIYTGVEQLIGRYGARLADPRAIQIHTKYVPDRRALAGLDRRQVESSIDRSLRRLRRESLDLVQLHWWDYGVPGYVEAAGWLDDLRRAGKIRHLGLTNFDLRRTHEIAAAGVPLTALQVQYSVLDRRPRGELAQWCHENGVGLLCYGGLAGGFLTDAYLTSLRDQAPDNRSQIKYRLIIDEIGGWGKLQLVLDCLAQIAQRHQVSVATTALRWVLDRSAVAGVIVGNGRRHRLADYLDLWRGSWQGEDFSELEQIVADLAGPAGAVYELERDPLGKHMAILRMNLNNAGVNKGE